MKLTHETDPNRTALVLLKRRSLYIMKDEVRFNYKHEILKDVESFFLNQKIQRERRISVICRNKPQ
jgi:alkylated DNA repair protein alkB family protein 7